MSTSTTAMMRLKHDYLNLIKDPIPYVIAHPLQDNMFEWRYCVRGPEDTPYKGGIYHGKLVFPNDFPFKPPSIYMLTPNGRFAVNVRLCLSISDYHPESWSPSWSVSAILTGLLSFMLEKANTVGSIVTSDDQKRCLAQQSGQYNLNDKIFCDLFPNVVQQIRDQVNQVNCNGQAQ